MWTYEQDTTNAISIKQDGEEKLQIIRDDDITDEDIGLADRVVALLNISENKS